LIQSENSGLFLHTYGPVSPIIKGLLIGPENPIPHGPWSEAQKP